ncbi:MAG: bacterial transcriptional activator domain-containing protein [Anaerolineae bacterium]|jgi:two-component SAPR family response regulator|nr:bacterial transcriptional activator domain-containing protein [Anaerolineae bacterium]
MISEIVTRVSFDSFRQKSKGKKVVLLYPWTNYKNMFLSHFLNRGYEGFLYYRVREDETNLVDAVAGIVSELEAALGGFGAETRKILQQASASDLGEAFAKDLATFSQGKESAVLYIDELDRIPADDNFQKFVRAIVAYLPENVQLAFSSRILTQEPWYELLTNGDAIVLGTEHRKNNVMFTVEDSLKPQLEVYSLGRGYVLVNGQQITNWDGALPRNLFFFFVDRPLVTRDEIFEVFWPTLSVKEATNVFHVTKRKISERISTKVNNGENYELTQYASGFYMPSDKIVRHYDVSELQESLEQAIVTKDDRKEEMLYLRAIDLYKAPFLQTINMKWVLDRREHLSTMYNQALIGMGRIYLKRNDLNRALGFFQRSLKQAPEREDIHRDMIRIYLDMGMVYEARIQYQRLTEVLANVVGIQPSRESRDLWNEIETMS